MTDLVEKVAEAIADSANKPVECLTQRSWARTDAYFLPNDRDRVAALAAINAVRLWDKSANAMQVREMTVGQVTDYIYSNTAFIKADARIVANTLAKLGTIRIVGEV